MQKQSEGKQSSHVKQLSQVKQTSQVKQSSHIRQTPQVKQSSHIGQTSRMNQSSQLRQTSHGKSSSRIQSFPGGGRNVPNTASNVQSAASGGVRPVVRSGSGLPPVSAAKHQKKGLTERLLIGGIATTTVAMATSLFVYFRPFTLEDVADTAKGAYSYVKEYIEDSKERKEAQKLAEIKASQEAEAASLAAETVAHIDRSADLGIVDFDAEPIFLPQEDSVYTFMLDTSIGPMLYYCQGDIRWKEYLYGGIDPISRYGCGPTCVAMVINSFSSTSVTPIEMADWAAANGEYAKHGGSYHSLIPNSLSAFGLKVESVTDRSAQNAAELLRTGHILVALMGRGSLTQNGHFIIIAQLCSNGNVYIADPANYENCTKEWNLQQLMDELKHVYDAGAPLWAVSLPDNEENPS